MPEKKSPHRNTGAVAGGGHSTAAARSREAEAAKPREVIHISSAQLALLRLEGRLRFLFQLRES
jgi:hypothetical protein